jgi:hypothetical protein
LLVAALLGACVASDVAAQQILKVEPAMGNLKPGQRVLVDDGTCPQGQIKQVIGGDHRKAGGRHNIERQRVCITRKK